MKRNGAKMVDVGHLADLPVVDATTSLPVTVTKADVGCGQRKNHRECAVAQAVKRMYGAVGVAVYPSVLHVLMPADRVTVQQAKRVKDREIALRPGDLAWHRFRLMADLQKQVLRFDRTGKCEAGVFRFYAPTPSQRLEARRLHDKARSPEKKGTSPKPTRRNASRAGWLRSREKLHTLVGGR